MANLNKVFLIGRLTQDPELRSTPGGAYVTDLRLAVNRSFTGRDGETKEETLFIDVTVWGRQAQNCTEYLKKGRQVHVEGYLRMDSWDDRTTGEKRTKVKVEADRVQFLDSRRDEPSGDDLGQPPREPAARRGPAESRPAPGGTPPPSSRPNPAPAARRPTAEPQPEEEVDDDIPF